MGNAWENQPATSGDIEGLLLGIEAAKEELVVELAEFVTPRRERIATAVLAALIASKSPLPYSVIAQDAVLYADALIQRLGENA